MCIFLTLAHAYLRGRPLPTPARAIIPPPRQCVRGGAPVVPAEAGTQGGLYRRSREGGNPSPVCTGTTTRRGGTLTGAYICATLPPCQSPAPGLSPHRHSGPRHTVSLSSHTRSRPGHFRSHLTPPAQSQMLRNVTRCDTAPRARACCLHPAALLSCAPTERALPCPFSPPREKVRMRGQAFVPSPRRGRRLG